MKSLYRIKWILLFLLLPVNAVGAETGTPDG